MGFEKEINRMRHPLYGALLFSPLYLLADKKLTWHAWTQAGMIRVRPNHLLT
jgi:hypothetical protein